MSITSDEFRGFGDFDEDEDPELPGSPKGGDADEDYDGFAGFGGFDEPIVSPVVVKQRNDRESPATVNPSPYTKSGGTKPVPWKAAGRASSAPKVHPAMAPLVSPAAPAAPIAMKKGSMGGMAELLRRESDQALKIEHEHQNRLKAERERQAGIVGRRTSDPVAKKGGRVGGDQPKKEHPKKEPLSSWGGFRRTQSTRPVGGESPIQNRRFRAENTTTISPGFGANFNLLAQTMSTLRDDPSTAASPKTARSASKKGGPDDDDYEDLDPKAVAAAKWTDGEIRKLIQVIKHEGQKDDDGKWFITFGVLFNETANIFDALSGICKTAKKYKVVAYAPEQLWQGQHDSEVIRLLKDTHDGIEIKRRKKLSVMTAPSAVMFRRTSMQTLNSECHICGKTVYPMEFIGASDKAFHKRCFRCATCNKMLSQNDYAVGRDGAFRCNAHHREFERSQL